MRISFGQHVLDTGCRQLLRGAEPVPLSPKALALLEVLITERPNPVVKRVLLDRVWPDVVVEEQNVKNTIAEIRSALGDDSDCIRTVQRFGYAFSGEAREQVREGVASALHWLYLEARAIPIVPGGTDLGRDETCAVCLSYPGVSRRHARITVSDEGATIEDTGSKNGTWVNGRTIDAPALLRNGDQIRIGTATLFYRAGLRTESTLTEPSDPSPPLRGPSPR